MAPLLVKLGFAPSNSEANRKIKEGAVSRATLVWKPGMAAWAAAESVAELQPLFAGAPPPLPT